MPGPTPNQPGWYDDGSGRERWFDGNAWTDHYRGEAEAGEQVGPDTAPIVGDSTVVVPAAQRPGPPPATGQLEQLQVGGGKGLRIATGVLGALVLVAVVVVGVLLLLGRDGDDEDKGTDDATSPSVTETTPDAPSSSLDTPTIDPSDFPSEEPTSEAPPPPEVPSNLPTEFPSDFLSDFPTDPEDFASWASDFLEP